MNYAISLALRHGRRIIQAVQTVKTALWQDGGVIAQCEFGPGAKPKNVYLVFETWEKML